MYQGNRLKVPGTLYWGIGELADPIRHPRPRAEDQYGHKFSIFCPDWSRGQALPGSHTGGSHMADFRYFPSWSGLAPDHLTPIGHRSKNPAFSMVRKIAGDGRVTPDHDERGRQRSYAIALGSHILGTTFRRLPSARTKTRQAGQMPGQPRSSAVAMPDRPIFECR